MNSDVGYAGDVTYTDCCYGDAALSSRSLYDMGGSRDLWRGRFDSISSR